MTASADPASSAQAARDPWRAVAPLEARHTGTFRDALIKESSGVAASRTQPGILWTINDGGNDPLLFATDTTGHPLGRFRVEGARNRDWEALTVTRCGAGDCIVIGDIGDNGESREWVTLYRIPEPRVASRRDGAPATLATATAQVAHYGYEDRGHDAEAIFFLGDEAHLITKGRSNGIAHYRLAGIEWREDQRLTAVRAAELPIPPSRHMGRWVTDAALAPGGRRLVIRTYTELYFFVLDDRGRLTPAEPPLACQVAGLEPQGEGVTWLDDRHLALTSERSILGGNSIHVVRCGE